MVHCGEASLAAVLCGKPPFGNTIMAFGNVKKPFGNAFLAFGNMKKTTWKYPTRP